AKMSIISSKQDIEVGEEILLLCKGGEGEITWRKDGEDIDDEDIVFKLDETSSKLVIKKAKLEDAGRYTCHCDFDNGHNDDTQTQLFVYGPSFGSTKTYHEFLEGTDGMVPCLVSGEPAVDVQWFRDNHLIPSTKYVCRAHIRGRPMIYKELSVSVVVNEEKKVLAGPDTNVSLLCLVDGLPKPNITWTPVQFNPSHHYFNSDRSQLTIKSVAREDFGEYVCTATNKISESSATIKLHVFEQLRVSVGEAASVSCNVTGHPQPELHWLNKQNGRTLVVDDVLMIDEVVPSDGGLYSCMAIPLVISTLKPYTSYTVEPDSPVLSSDEIKIEGNTFSVPLKQMDDGGTPVLQFNVRYRQDKEEAEWKEMQLSPDANSVSLKDLAFGSTYQLEVAAVNANGSSIPSTFNFTIAEQPKSSMTKGSVVGIVMVIFLVVFLAVDATCCYRNHCGLLMSIAVKLFGQKVPGIK
uniref:Neural cell adhesion molecule 3 n=1 Tax=Amphilophus citrinellus TaxID=61819 RepID=A0A3Q0SD08_AMPCI